MFRFALGARLIELVRALLTSERILPNRFEAMMASKV
jgi:hypothetical protein